MESILKLLGGILLGYAIVSVSESFLHNNVQHARAQVRRFWERYSALMKPFLRAYFSHHTIHHCRTFRKNHVTQFRSEEERERLDEALTGFHGALIKRERYGVSVSGVGVLMFLLPVLVWLPVVYWALGGWVLAGTLLPYAVYPASSRNLHPYLHMRYEDALKKASPPMRWFLGTAYCRFIYRHHYLHHRYVRCNYNLMFGGDWLLGVHRPPAPEDLENLRALGLPVD